MLTVIELINKLSPTERRRRLLARISNQRGRIQYHHGRWTVLYWLRDSSSTVGWRRVRDSLNADSYNAALLEAARVMGHVNERNQPGRSPSRIPLVSEFVDGQWSAYLIKRERSPSTLAAYKSNLKRYVLPLIGDKRIHQCSPADVTQILDKASKGKEAKSMVNLYALLRVLFEVAQQHDLIKESPVRPKIHRPMFHTKEKPSLSKAEAFQVFTNCPLLYRPLFMTAFLTGYRSGELLALQWSNVDEVTGFIKATHRMYNGKRLLGVKTPKSRKPIRMAADLRVVLGEHRAVSQFNTPDDYLFCQSDGRPYDPQWLLENVWYPALRKVGIEPGKRTHGFHLIRHTAGSILAELTGNLVLVRDFLRHEELSTTNTYLHSTDESTDGASEALAQAIFRDEGGVN